MEIITKIDPLTYGIDGMRGSLIGISKFGMHVDLIILSGITAILLVLGSYLFSKIQI